jgi:hypothetical protein
MIIASTLSVFHVVDVCSVKGRTVTLLFVYPMLSEDP